MVWMVRYCCINLCAQETFVAIVVTVVFCFVVWLEWEDQTGTKENHLCPSLCYLAPRKGLKEPRVVDFVEPCHEERQVVDAVYEEKKDP